MMPFDDAGIVAVLWSILRIFSKFYAKWEADWPPIMLEKNEAVYDLSAILLRCLA